MHSFHKKPLRKFSAILPQETVKEIQRNPMFCRRYRGFFSSSSGIASGRISAGQGGSAAAGKYQ
jgi:hypothetical protein